MSGVENPFAFPIPAENGNHAACFGMTLRDWFAGQALAGIITATSAGQHQVVREGRGVVAGMTHDAFEIADAMLAERVK